MNLKIFWVKFAHSHLKISYLREYDKFRSKLASFDLVKHTSLNKQTNTLAYYVVRTLQIRNVFMVQVP